MSKKVKWQIWVPNWRNSNGQYKFDREVSAGVNPRSALEKWSEGRTLNSKTQVLIVPNDSAHPATVMTVGFSVLRAK